MSQRNVRPTWCTHFFDPQLDEFRGSLDPHERKWAGRTHDPLDVAHAKFGIRIYCAIKHSSIDKTTSIKALETSTMNPFATH